MSNAQLPDRAAARALEYPYGKVVGEGATAELLKQDLDDFTPLIAYGANASQFGLANKLLGDREIHRLRVVISNFAIGYSAHISPYGAVPATLLPAPGSEVEVQLQFLTSAELELIHDTERNYSFDQLTGVELSYGGLQLGTASPHAYVSLHGALTDGRSLLALSERPANNFDARSLNQLEVQQLVSDFAGGGEPAQKFAAVNSTDPAARTRATSTLRELSRPLTVVAGELRLGSSGAAGSTLAPEGGKD